MAMDNKKIIILSCATKNLEWQYAVTNELKMHYCRKHGYFYRFDIMEADENNRAYTYWHRTEMLNEAISSGEYDYAIYMDVDVWPNDMDRRLESLLTDNESICVTVCHDHLNRDIINKWMASYVNCGIIMFKCCEESKNIITAWTTMPEPSVIYMQTVDPGLFDQPYFNARLLFDEYFYGKVDIKNPEEMNWFLNFPRWEDKFLIHAAGCGRGLCTQEDFKKAVLSTVDRCGMQESDVIKTFREEFLKDEKKGVDTPTES